LAAEFSAGEDIRRYFNDLEDRCRILRALGTKTGVPLFWSHWTIEDAYGGSVCFLHDGLGAARGQRLCKESCASHPTHHFLGLRPVDTPGISLASVK